MGQLSKLASQTAIYGLSSIVGRFLSYLLVPLYTEVFAPGEYGVVTELYAYMAFFNVVFTYGLETAYFRFASKSDDPLSFFNLTQSSIIVTTMLLGGFLYFSSGFVADALGYVNQTHIIKWLVVILMADALVALPFARLRLEGKAKRFASLKLANISLNIGLNLFFLVLIPFMEGNSGETILPSFLANLGVGYVFLSNMVANLFYLPFFASYFTRLKFSLDKRLWPILAYSLPLLLMGFAGVTNEMLSRALLRFLLPEDFYPDQTKLEALGIFGACYKFSVFMTLAVQAFRYASEPFFFSNSANKESPELFSRVMHAFIIFSTFSWLVISLLLGDFAPILLRQDAYLKGLHVVPWLLGGGVFLGIYFNLSVWYKLTDKTMYGAWITVFGAVVTIMLNILLIPRLGYLGGAIAAFSSYFVMVLISFYLGQKRYYIPYQVVKGLIYIILAAVFIWAFYFWGIDTAFRYPMIVGEIFIFLILVYLMDIRSGLFKREKAISSE
ncbi:MAG: O-antigen/teichoic acid export membrane protein [Cyclobacteriaceae bacterium]